MKAFHVVAVKDELIGSFLQPTYGEDINALIRIFKTQINTVPIWKDNASDFSFYKLGEFDAETGHYVEHIEKIASGHSLIEKEEYNVLHGSEQTTEKNNA